MEKSSKPILEIIHGGLNIQTEKIRRRSDVRIFEVTRENKKFKEN